MTEKDKKFEWTHETENAFEKLMLLEAPILSFPDLSKPFILSCDASDNSLGCALQQYDDSGSLKPVAYARRQLQGSKKRYTVTEKELLSVIYGITI